MKKEIIFDVVIIGAGPAGRRSAQLISQLGKKTVLLEQELSNANNENQI
jgi:pyruvate/2-oxoglutarate dehydrogenase complex dihydrolipoamide dehydrogenase (E3) component